MVMEVIGFLAVIAAAIVAIMFGAAGIMLSMAFAGKLDKLGVVFTLIGLGAVWWAIGESPIHLSLSVKP